MIYVNFVANDLNYFYDCSADDLKIYLGFNKQDSVLNVAECQAYTDKLVAVTSFWGLYMNRSKCKLIRISPRNYPLSHSVPILYSITDTSLKFIDSHSDLDVTID